MGVVRVGRHYVSLPFLVLGLLEAALIVVAVYAGTFARFSLGDVDPVLASREFVGPLLPRALLVSVVLIVSMMAMGLYQARLREGFSGIVVRLALSLGLALLALTLIFYILPGVYLGRGALATSLAIAAVLLVITRFLFLRVVDQEALKRRVLILGAGEKAASIKRFFRRRSDRRGFRVVGYVHDPAWRRAPDIDPELVVELDGPLLDYALAHRVQEIVVALDERRRELPLDALLDCRLANIEVCELMDFFERQSGKVKLDLLSPGWMIFAKGFTKGNFGANLERGLDILASLALLAVTWPFMLLTAVAILAESGGKGSVLYRQTRVGLDGKHFEVLKFRSMRMDAEKDGQARWAAKNDSRVTRVGRFIRAARIDELPQIFNVLRGDMSFVGPRPERPEFVAQLTSKLPYYNERHRVKPGITGWAQLWYPYGASDRDAMEKLQYDLYYVKNHTLMLDLLVLIQTVEVVLFGRGR